MSTTEGNGRGTGKANNCPYKNYHIRNSVTVCPEFRFGFVLVLYDTVSEKQIPCSVGERSL